MSKHKCEICGKPADNANCHSHAPWCVYYCEVEKPIVQKPQGSLPIDFGCGIYLFVAIYVSIKFVNKWKS